MNEEVVHMPPSAPSTATARPLLRVRLEPSSGWVGLKLRELWAHHELVYFLIWRDVKVRYKQTALGAAWAVIQPLFTMIVFTLFFGRLARIPSDGLPYPIFTYAALVPWMFFANGLAQSADSLAGSANLLRKVYFPRLAIPVATVLSGVVDFAIAFSVLLLMMLAYGVWPTANILWLPALLLLALCTSLGVGLWLSALNVQYRDVRYVVPFLVQFWMLATPIAYPSSMIPEPWRTIYGLNPMSGVIEGFRWALLGTGHPPGMMLAVSVAVSLALLVGGAFYFRRLERTFADIV
jgi:lipopolysaccharide transport system permease protein